VQLVADANVLLSAVIGGRAALVLRHEQVQQVFTPTAAYDEVFEYLAPLAKKKRLQLDTLLLTLAALPVTVAWSVPSTKITCLRPSVASASATPTTLTYSRSRST
jgi:predicted nucleic acid-binding protein